MSCGVRIADCGLVDGPASVEHGTRGVVVDAAFKRVGRANRQTIRNFP